MPVSPIKIHGKKTRLSSWISEYLKREGFRALAEPFAGSCEISLNAPGFEKYFLCDLNPHLIRFYKAVCDGLSGADVRAYLKTVADYYAVRERFNREGQEGNPLDFLYLNRACFNGLLRFNARGEFNAPWRRKPFSPAHVTRICRQVDELARFFRENEVELRCADFRETLSSLPPKTLIYADPPYLGRNTGYFGGWREQDENELLAMLEGKDFLLSAWSRGSGRENPLVRKLRERYRVVEAEHEYFVGGRGKKIVEALVLSI